SYSNNHVAKDFIDAIGRVIEEVICMIELTEGTANAIVKKLNIFIYAKNLPINHLMNIESNRASIMLAAQLKQQNPYLIEIHCISHHLALASEDAAASIPYL
ncbi:9175_t:CDS:2, partial [Scutellospora calospora]